MLRLHEVLTLLGSSVRCTPGRIAYKYLHHTNNCVVPTVIVVMHDSLSSTGSRHMSMRQKGVYAMGSSLKRYICRCSNYI